MKKKILLFSGIFFGTMILFIIGSLILSQFNIEVYAKTIGLSSLTCAFGFTSAYFEK